MLLVKEARKPSTDPIQEKLRAHKDIWNRSVSEFIDNLLHLKKLINGHPSKFYETQARHSLGEELPKDPASIIGVLASDFTEIARDCSGIIQEQNNYAKVRRRKKPHTILAPIQPPSVATPQNTAAPQLTPSTDNVAKVSNMADNYLLIIQAAMDEENKNLRKHKAVWNKSVKEFINNLIHLKNMVNGKPSKFYESRGMIGEAFPKDPASIIGVLASDFMEIAGDCNKIISEQAAYAKVKAKKRETAAATPKTGMLSSNSLIVESSNRITRLLSKLAPPWFTKEKRTRFSLLKSLISLDKLLLNFQSQIVSKDSKSINNAIKTLMEMENKIYKISSEVSDFQPKKEDNTQSKFLTKNEDVDNIILNYTNNKSYYDINAPTLSNYFNNLINTFSNAIGAEKSEKAKKILTVYDMMTKEALKPSGLNRANEVITNFLNNKEEFNKKEPSLSNYFSKLIEDFNNSKDIEKKEFAKKILSVYDRLIRKISKAPEGYVKSNFSYKINKLADNFLARWWNKVRHTLSSDETTAIRFELNNMSVECKGVINEMMDSLEKGLNQSEIFELTKKIDSIIREIRGKIKPIQRILGVSPEISIDNEPKVSKEQKSKIDNLIRNKYLADLAKKYW